MQIHSWSTSEDRCLPQLHAAFCTSRVGKAASRTDLAKKPSSGIRDASAAAKPSVSTCAWHTVLKKPAIMPSKKKTRATEIYLNLFFGGLGFVFFSDHGNLAWRECVSFGLYSPFAFLLSFLEIRIPCQRERKHNNNLQLKLTIMLSSAALTILLFTCLLLYIVFPTRPTGSQALHFTWLPISFKKTDSGSRESICRSCFPFLEDAEDMNHSKNDLYFSSFIVFPLLRPKNCFFANHHL